MNSKVGLLKLIPAMDSGVLDYMAEHCDAVILESFGVGGIPTYDSGDFHKSIEDLVRTGKTVVMTTQVTNEGSNMSVYEVGKSIKKEFDLLEAYDMTLEAVVTKLMWILGQTSDPEEIREMFYKTLTGICFLLVRCMIKGYRKNTSDSFFGRLSGVIFCHYIDNVYDRNGNFL